MNVDSRDHSVAGVRAGVALARGSLVQPAGRSPASSLPSLSSARLRLREDPVVSWDGALTFDNLGDTRDPVAYLSCGFSSPEREGCGRRYRQLILGDLGTSILDTGRPQALPRPCEGPLWRGCCQGLFPICD